MNERLTIQDLTDLLAAKHSMTKKDAESFVKEFFLLIEQALEDEKTVKIKGLGTFKLIDVDNRESVKVNTGERFQIKGHTKVSFSPDTNLRDAINKPFAHFETVVLNDNTILEDTPMEEEEVEEEMLPQVPLDEADDDADATVIAESDATEKEVEKEEVVVKTEIEEEVGQLEDKETSEEMPIVEQQPEPIEKKEVITAEMIIKQELLHANQQSAASVGSPQEDATEQEKIEQASQTVSKKEVLEKENSPIPYLITLIVVVLLACGGGILFIYFPDLLSSSSDKDMMLDVPPVTTQPIQPKAQLSDTIEQKDTIKEVVIPVKTTTSITPQQPAVATYQDSASYKITGTKTKYTIKEGETLTKVSLRFYGTKAMWPYIVEHNPEVIKNPDNVSYGTTIKIPELTKK